MSTLHFKGGRMALADRYYMRRRKKKVLETSNGIVFVPVDAFRINESGIFKPERLPKNEELVVVEKGEPTNNVIILEDWRATDKIYLMSMVIFWIRGTQYTFQVLPSDSFGYGKFSQIGVDKPIRQPGKDARTSSGATAKFS